MSHFSCVAFGGSGVSPLLIYSGRSFPLGPTARTSSAWAGSHTPTYRPKSHAWLMGAMRSPPNIYSERSPTPWPNKHVILCVGRPSHSNLQVHFSCMAYGVSGVSPFIYIEGSPRFPLQPIILCVGRPLHSYLQAHFSSMAYRGGGVSPLI